MSDDWTTVPCSACPEPIDLTQPHFAVASQIEEHDPPGHVMGIGYSTQVATYHLHDVPAHLDGRRDDLVEVIEQQQAEAAELATLRARDETAAGVARLWDGTVYDTTNENPLWHALDALARAHQDADGGRDR